MKHFTNFEASRNAPEVCAGLIREALGEDFRRIWALAGAALVALEAGNDYDLGRAFDQLVKIQLSAAESLEDLVEAGARP
jgi:hypothetical protein